MNDSEEVLARQALKHFILIRHYTGRVAVVNIEPHSRGRIQFGEGMSQLIDVDLSGRFRSEIIPCYE